jgi:hypothetical protein
MICNLWIEFQPEQCSTDKLLQTIEAAGFGVHGMRLIPGNRVRRSALTVDIADCGDRAGVAELERTLRGHGAISVIHTSQPTASTVAA